MSTDTVLVWFRRDLRLTDHSALSAAAQTQKPVIPVYILDDDAEGNWPLGGAARVWIHGSLLALNEELQKKHSLLTLRKGDSVQHLLKLAQENKASKIHCNARFDPPGIAQQNHVREALAEHGIELIIHRGEALIWPIETLRTQSGTPYQVYTPFFKRCVSELPIIQLLSAPDKLTAPSTWPECIPLEELQLLPKLDWADEMRTYWQPGEAEAQKRLHAFIENRQDTYGTQRDIPSVDGTSGLSAYLAHGEITPRQIWVAVSETQRASAQAYLREIIWREFAHHVLYHFPFTMESPLKAKYNDLPWRMNEASFQAWAHGKTGYPIIDAGMRQLWRLGWMHNRVRMIVASFLTKDLMISWYDGARWFWDTLVDADLAQNSLNWQWAGGCGADAQPFFRIFNPVSQSQKFDAEGRYIRRWVPELAKLPAKSIHQPWEAPPLVLLDAGVKLGENYPFPMVDHAEARLSALAAFKKMGTHVS